MTVYNYSSFWLTLPYASVHPPLPVRHQPASESGSHWHSGAASTLQSRTRFKLRGYHWASRWPWRAWVMRWGCGGCGGGTRRGRFALWVHRGIAELWLRLHGKVRNAVVCTVTLQVLGFTAGCGTAVDVCPALKRGYYTLWLGHPFVRFAS